MKTKVYLVGPMLTRSGYGEQARFAMRALRSREDLFDIYMQPLHWGQTSWIPFYDEEKAWVDQTIEKTIGYLQQGGEFDVSVQVTIPNEWKKITPINVGYTAGIESTKVSHEWIQAVNQMDKVIVVSSHSKQVFENTTYTGIDEATRQEVKLACQTDIEVVNYPVKKYDKIEPLELDVAPNINFLSVAQWGPRKNVTNMIKWFVEEFHDEEVGFIIKTNQSKNSLMDREFCEGQLKAHLKPYPERKCSVYMVHGDMTDEEMHALYTNEKVSAFVGIPHGEGFGLPFFESAYSGLPVVATGWSGQLDFLVDEKHQEHFYNVSFDIRPIQDESVWENILIRESGWAYAREDSYKEQLRQCYNDVTNNTGHVADACEYASALHERFEESKMYAQFVEAMGLQIDHEWADTLAQVEIL